MRLRCRQVSYDRALLSNLHVSLVSRLVVPVRSSASAMEQAELQLPISALRTSDNTNTDHANDNAELPMTRDFAYPDKHALFHCALQKDDELRRNSIEEEHGWEDGPPWPEDDEEDLTHDAIQQDEGSGIETTKDDVQGRAVALFDFAPEHENEFALTEGQILFVSSRHGLGWLVAVDPDSGI